MSDGKTVNPVLNDDCQMTSNSTPGQVGGFFSGNQATNNFKMSN